MDKDVVWKYVDESQKITFDMVKQLYTDKTKAVVKKNVTEVLEKDKPRQYLPPAKEMTLAIVMARWPDPKDIMKGVETLSEQKISIDNLESLTDVKNWPFSEFMQLLNMAKANPDVIWGTSESYFIKFTAMDNIYDRMKVWLFYRKIESIIKSIEDQQETLFKAFNSLRDNENLKKLLGAVLKVGNCLNAGNKNRGQADGFYLDCLSKPMNIKDEMG